MAGLSENDLKLIEQFVGTPPRERCPDPLRSGAGDAPDVPACPACGRSGDDARAGDCPDRGAAIGG